MPKTGLGSMVGHPETRGALVGETGAGRRGRDEAERLVDNCGVFFEGRGGILKLGAWADRAVRVGVVPIIIDRPDRQEPGTGEGGSGVSTSRRSPQSSRFNEEPRGVGEDKGGAAWDSRCSNLEWIRRGRDGNKKSRDGIGGAAAAVDALGQKLRGLHRVEHHAEEGAASPDSRHHKGLAGLKPDRSSPGADTFAGFHNSPQTLLFLRERSAGLVVGFCFGFRPHRSPHRESPRIGARWQWT